MNLLVGQCTFAFLKMNWFVSSLCLHWSRLRSLGHTSTSHYMSVSYRYVFVKGFVYFFVKGPCSCNVMSFSFQNLVGLVCNWRDTWVSRPALNKEALPIHSALMRNLLKVWKTWTGLLWGGIAWSKGPKSALSKIPII